MVVEDGDINNNVMEPGEITLNNIINHMNGSLPGFNIGRIMINITIMIMIMIIK